MSWSKRILSVLFPTCCIVCRKVSYSICRNCFDKLPIVISQKCIHCHGHSAYGFTHPFCIKKYSLLGTSSYFIYKNEVKKIIKKIKYGGEYESLYKIFEYINTLVIKENLDLYIKNLRSAIFIPVPLYKSRYLQRGFNQSELIAENLSKIIKINTNSKLLIRIKNTKTQASIHTRKERAENVKNSFKCDKIQVGIDNVILVDDVWSSGATLRSCALSIKKSNPQINVYAWTLAEGQ